VVDISIYVPLLSVHMDLQYIVHRQRKNWCLKDMAMLCVQSRI